MDSRQRTGPKTALITGASSGIGFELAELFARDGYDLVLTARSEEKLRARADELAARFGISARIIAKDLSSPQAPDAIFNELQRESVFVDVLVNNAGFGNHGLFHQTDLAEELEMIQVNLTSLTHLTKLFIREMVRRGGGKILNVASVAAFLPGPLMAVYYATKAYVLSFSEALAEELRGTGVRVTCLSPGPTRTDFQRRAGIGPIKILDHGAATLDSKTVARRGYEGLMRNKRVVVTGFMNRFFVFGMRFVPRSVLARIVWWGQEQKQK